MIFEKSAFDIVKENLRATLRYLRYELHMPPEIIQLQVEAILNAFLIEERIKSEATK